MQKNILESVRLTYLSRKKNLPIELKQSQEEGRDLSEFAGCIQNVLEMENTPEAEQEALALYERFRSAPRLKGYAYQEPESLEEIVASFPKTERAKVVSNLEDRLMGAILGRVAGCLLGQPVECWMRSRICGLLHDTGNYPIKDYISSNIGEDLRCRYDVQDEPGNYGNRYKSWKNLLNGAPEDDDTNYTAMGLKILEDYGVDFTPMDVAECFTTNVPVFMACTAERMAYKNIVNGILPPESATYGNPYREWLGAQIRVDAYAYINPGDPCRAAEMAVKDACVTHTKNGIYAAAFCAALIAASATSETMEEAIQTAMDYLPKQSRLFHKLREFLALAASGKNAQELIAYIHERYREDDAHDWCHVIPNDMVICMALLCGGKDFGKVIGLAVEAGFDTDCNAATVGSAFGMMYGRKAIPSHWIDPLKGGFRTRIGCDGWISFDELCRRLMKLYQKQRED